MTNPPEIPTLLVDTPDAGLALAIKIARLPVKATQPDPDVRARLRKIYEEDASALIAASQVVATNFATIASANNYWKDNSR
jgi:hypothetical protein